MTKVITNLDSACRAFGWAGGTIYQVAKELGMSGCGSDLALMPGNEFERLLKFYFDAKEKIDSKQ
jgi:hypothetical protein